MAVPNTSKPVAKAEPAPSLGPPTATPQHLSDVPDDWLEGMGSVTLESLSAEDQKTLHNAYKAIGDPRLYPYVLAGLRNDINVLLHGNLQIFPDEGAEPKATEKTPVAAAIESFVNLKKGTPEASMMASTGGGTGMLDPNVPLATWVGTPKIRVVTPDGKRVIAWGNTLPTTEDGSKRQEAAVCAAFNPTMKLEIDDFMTKVEFNHVMGGNGSPRYNYHTGYYYDYGAYPDGHPSGVLICTDPTLLVAKKPPHPRPQ